MLKSCNVVGADIIRPQDPLSEVNHTLACGRHRALLVCRSKGSKLTCEFGGVLFVHNTPPEIKDFDPLSKGVIQ